MRLIDADKIRYAKDWVVTDRIPKVGGYNAKAIYRVTKEEIDAMPTVDAVPVVRCKDCKHYQFANNRAFGFPVKRCKWTGYEDIDDYDFCSAGRRKDGEQS